MKRLIHSIGVFLLSQFLLSCNSCGCKKQDNHILDHFDIQGMVVGFTNEPVNYYNEFTLDTTISNINITEDSVAIESDKVSLIVLFKSKLVAQNKPFQFSLINSAYACSPKIPGQSGSREAIDSFYVVPIGRLGNDSIYTDTLFTLNHINTIFVHYNDTIFEMYGTKISGGIGQGSNYLFTSSTKIYFNFYNNFIHFNTNNFIRLKVVLKLKNGERYEELSNYIKLI